MTTRLLLISLLLSTTHAQRPDAIESELTRLARQLLDEHRVPGVAIAVIRDGAVAWTEGVGIANANTGAKVTADTVFNVGSVSKCVAGIGFMQLVEAGIVDLDAPIEASLTRWKLPESEFDAKAVTLRRLLSHTAGLSLHGYPGFLDEAELPTLEESLSGATGGRGDVRLIHAPGSKWQYSGGGVTMAQLMLEERVGRGFAEYMRENVFAPLEMSSTDYGWTERARRHAAVPHDENGRVIGIEHFTALAAAGLQTTVRDLAKFGAAMLAEDDDGVGVLTADSVRDMWQVVPPRLPRRASGIGFQLMQFDDLELIGHTGSNSGWQAAFFLYPPRRDGIVLFTNGDNGRDVLMGLCRHWVWTLQDREKRRD